MLVCAEESEPSAPGMVPSTAGRRPKGDIGIEVVAWSWPSEVEFVMDWDTDVPGKRELGAVVEKEDRLAGSRSSVGNDAAAASLFSMPVAAI